MNIEYFWSFHSFKEVIPPCATDVMGRNKLIKIIPMQINPIEASLHFVPNISNMDYRLVLLTMYDSPAFVLKTEVLLSSLFNSIFLLPGPYTE